MKNVGHVSNVPETDQKALEIATSRTLKTCATVKFNRLLGRGTGLDRIRSVTNIAGSQIAGAVLYRSRELTALHELIPALPTPGFGEIPTRTELLELVLYFSRPRMRHLTVAEVVRLRSELMVSLRILTNSATTHSWPREV